MRGSLLVHGDAKQIHMNGWFSPWIDWCIPQSDDVAGVMRQLAGETPRSAGVYSATVGLVHWHGHLVVVVH